MYSRKRNVSGYYECDPGKLSPLDKVTLNVFVIPSPFSCSAGVTGWGWWAVPEERSGFIAGVAIPLPGISCSVRLMNAVVRKHRQVHLRVTATF